MMPKIKKLNFDGLSDKNEQDVGGLTNNSNTI
jgi:hypothetical protein